MQYAYKVVRPEGIDRLVSANCYFDRNSILQLTYKEGKVTRAVPGTKGVYVFIDKMMAMEFASEFHDAYVYECEVIGKLKKQRVILRPDSLYVTFYRIPKDPEQPIRDYKSHFLFKPFVLPAPVGTYTCPAIRLLERVY